MSTQKFTCFKATIFCFLLCFLSLTGCSRTAKQPVSTVNEEALDEAMHLQELTAGTVKVDKENLFEYARITDCFLSEDQEHITLSLSMPAIPQSDDAYLYLFRMNTWDDTYSFTEEPVAQALKGENSSFQFEYTESYLFSKFVPALLINEEYVSLSMGHYITNPELLAENQDEFPLSTSKKGLLLDPELLGTPLLTDLGIQHAIYNIPLSLILGKTSDEKFPTITYDYEGTTYYFNGAIIDNYDNLFTYLTNSGMLSTAIILNDWNEAYPEIIHPLARVKNSGAYYYAFNTAEEKGCRHLEAVASFLAARYNGSGHGLVSSWVISNEINQHTTWNYMDTTDIEVYASQFEKSLRIFYNAIKSNFAEAKVYFSVDHDWNNNKNDNTKYFNAKDLVSAINTAAIKQGNYDWGLAIHPYPDPLTRINYWSIDYDKSINSPTLTIMNLSTVTDFLTQKDFLDRSGKVRSITITELGFSSVSGERLQAAAFAYCYLIIDANPYIDAFIMNRQTDAKEEVAQGLAFGIYELDHSPKYIVDVFTNIDTPKALDYTDFMLNILGADSLEEALSWAE